MLDDDNFNTIVEYKILILFKEHFRIYFTKGIFILNMKIQENEELKITFFLPDMF
jgi:hypothetical protein